MNFLVLCLTSLGSFVALFLVAKFIGHKQIAQLDFFDYINGITIGSIAAEMATDLPVSSQRPATPNDMDLAPEQELLFTEMIMDGRILDDNLKRMGLDLKWLDEQLKQRHIHSAKNVFLAVCDKNLKLVLYENGSGKK